MTRATTNLWALIVNDPTADGVRALCESVQTILDLADCARTDAGMFEGGKAGLAIGRAWPKLGPGLRAAAVRIGWRPIGGE